jgi:hypothetical protein
MQGSPVLKGLMGKFKCRSRDLTDVAWIGDSAGFENEEEA